MFLKIYQSRKKYPKQKNKGGQLCQIVHLTEQPEAKSALDRFKYEVAGEIGVPLKDGYNGDLTSRQNGSVGGYMVKKMIEAQEQQMSGK